MNQLLTSKRINYFLVIIFIVVSLADLVTTIIWLDLHLAKESNPFILPILENFGYLGLILWKIFGVTVVSLGIIYLKLSNFLIIWVSIICGITAGVSLVSLEIILIGVGVLS